MVPSRKGARARLLAHLPNEASDRSDHWAMIWDRGDVLDFLPWDIGMPNPALVEVLTDHKDLIRTYFKRGTSAEKKKKRKEEEQGGRKDRKKAFVPGCGRWYDINFLIV